MTLPDPQFMHLLTKSIGGDQSELDEAITIAENQLAGLRALKKAIGNMPAKPAKGTVNTGYQKAIAKFIMENGPKKPPTIAQALGLNMIVVRHAIDVGDWFDRQTDGIHLTVAGVIANKADDD